MATLPWGRTTIRPGGIDVVALGDFLYVEPRAIPAQASAFLLGLGLVALTWVRRRVARIASLYGYACLFMAATT